MISIIVFNFKNLNSYNYESTFFLIIDMYGCKKSGHFEEEAVIADYREVNDIISTLISRIGSGKHLHSRSSSGNYPYYTFQSFDDFLAKVDSLESLTQEDLIAYEDHSGFVSYHRLFESIASRQEEVVYILDSIVQAQSLSDSTYLDSLYNHTHGALLNIWSNFVVIDTFSDGAMALSRGILHSGLCKVLNPIGIVVIEDDLYHFHDQGFDIYEIANLVNINHNEISLEGLTKIRQGFHSGLKLKSRNNPSFHKRCEHEREGWKIIVDHNYIVSNGPNEPFNFFVSLLGEARTFRRRLWGLWWDIRKAHQISLDWAHSGSEVRCIQDPRRFLPVRINFNGFGNREVHNENTFFVQLPCLPCWRVMLCESVPDLTQSMLRGEAIVGNGNWVISCTVNHP